MRRQAPAPPSPDPVGTITIERPESGKIGNTRTDIKFLKQRICPGRTSDDSPAFQRRAMGIHQEKSSIGTIENMHTSLKSFGGAQCRGE